MSGGSWDYIQSALDCGKFVPAEELKRFAERVKVLHPDADAPIHRRLETMIELAEQYERTFESLVEVFGLVDSSTRETAEPIRCYLYCAGSRRGRPRATSAGARAWRLGTRASTATTWALAGFEDESWWVAVRGAACGVRRVP